MRWLIARYARWLHLRWPAGTVEPLPELDEHGGTAVPGLYVAGDLTGVPLLKFALDRGARVAQHVAADRALRADGRSDVLDLAIVGAGVAGMAAAAEARRLGLAFRVVEAAEPFATVANFPRAKPIFTFPRAFAPAGTLRVTAAVKEPLLAELRAQAAGIAVTPGRVTAVERSGGLLRLRFADRATLEARRVLLAIGRSGHRRRLGVPGESLDKVVNRLHDPADFRGRRCVVVGGGDAAVETAVALAGSGAAVTFVHRGAALVRPKAENLAALERLRVPAAGGARDAAPGVLAPAPPPLGRIALRTGTRVREITPDAVRLAAADGAETLANDAVFTMIGRDPPLDLLRRSGVRIANEWTRARRLGLAAFLLGCVWLYDWKSGGWFNALWSERRWFPFDLPDRLTALGGAAAAQAADPATFVGTLAISAAAPAFWYTLAYSAAIVIFGWRRMRRRRTPYVTAQTWTLILIQVLPLFLLPEILLPLLHHRGLLPQGLADALFPAAGYGHGREFWRAYGLILAWPLNVYNVFTREPLGAWLAISAVQTLVLIPAAIWFFGKGAYCGWICSCGALAETLGDTHRHRMPHGPFWNRLNLAGQAILAIAVALLAARIAGWLLPPGNAVAAAFDPWLKEPYKWAIDVFLAGVLGYGLYFWFSGRVWCRFFCPLAALMHVYARFSRFAIVAEKPRCISCNVCTSVCHQGIDVMSFANQGAPMQDPQCVRCSACVHACPTGVLQFGRVRRDGTLIAVDSLAASPVRMRERA